MRTSLIINTASGDPYLQRRHNLYRRASYADRIAMLHEILLSADGFDEVIVVGQPPAALEVDINLNVIVVSISPRKRDRSDALWAREVGARMSTGDLLVFTHDDHKPELGFSDKLRRLAREEPEVDLWIPRRVHGKTAARLNNGAKEGYMGGHTLAMKRWLWARVPWNKLETEFWDVPMTREWQRAGAVLRWTDELDHYDLEVAEDET